MSGDHYELFVALAFLGAAIVFVPIFTRLGLGAVLGYLAAGVVLGPHLLGVVTTESHELMEVAELGVVFLLFLIGLELNVSRLWALRRDIFGLGALQIVVCGGAIALYPLLVAGEPWAAALIAGLGLALSSTAMVMRLIEERGAMRLPYGQKTFAVLLMQDLAIVPLLLLVSLLAPGEEMTAGAVAVSVGQAALAVAAIVLVGHYLLSPTLRLLARFGGTEIMTAAALFVVLAAAAAMVSVGLSMAMGAFLAGVLLAESNYRHELTADIEPFRGLLLGLFFLSVGMAVNLPLVAASWPILLGGLVVLVVAKTAIVYGLVRLFGGDHMTAVKSGLLLSQGGEFGFVLYAEAARRGVMSAETEALLTATVALSMITTPFLMKVLPRLLIPPRPKAEPDENYAEADGDVLLIGFGRFGQFVSQMMLAGGFAPIILDADADRVTEARRFGNRVFFGDGMRLDVLRAVGAHRCRMIAICTSPAEQTDAIVELVRSEFPQAQVFARAFDRRHALRLVEAGVDYQRRETFDTALRFGRDALMALGLDEIDAKDTEIHIRRIDRDRFEFQRRDGMVEGYKRWKEVTPEPYTRRPPEDEADAELRDAAE